MSGINDIRSGGAVRTDTNQTQRVGNVKRQLPSKHEDGFAARLVPLALSLDVGPGHKGEVRGARAVDRRGAGKRAVRRPRLRRRRVCVLLIRWARFVPVLVCG